MLPLLCVGVIFLFSLLGSVVFLTCVLVPSLRSCALSAALWCFLWGPSLVLLLLFAVVGIISAALLSKLLHIEPDHASRLLAVLGWIYLIAGILAVATATTISFRVHQFLIDQLPFPLFRPYAAAASAGIGCVYGCSFGLWLLVDEFKGLVWLFVWSVCMLALAFGFGAIAYTSASVLRIKAPEEPALVPTEFEWLSL